MLLTRRSMEFAWIEGIQPSVYEEPDNIGVRLEVPQLYKPDGKGISMPRFMCVLCARMCA